MSEAASSLRTAIQEVADALAHCDFEESPCAICARWSGVMMPLSAEEVPSVEEEGTITTRSKKGKEKAAVAEKPQMEKVMRPRAKQASRQIEVGPPNEHSENVKPKGLGLNFLRGLKGVLGGLSEIFHHLSVL
ncbi:hypothetical protein NEOLEDRAFT_1175264 [Neolentinus lepideus HHB14362 ss-1]|uniref:Uncharacterized protein n=1 Tax=Neolentinus lepideus HHB14362 ss-1 TaxID=1314782 RepID=A0A165UZ92_9AGAM|nr:hypothetical protein NEOLEDRAFT_1175264 [Neolentinus lepideus HHB14362 ss-1]